MMLNTSVLKSGDKVIYETNVEYEIIYTYDVDGTLISFYYDNDITVKIDGNEYFYIKDLQGNISIIVDENGDIVVEYSYDAWGNIISTKEYNADGTEKTELDIAKINPYRYRGYRYDEETGWYYLNSRYYNPEIGRFINADGLIGPQGVILGHNMYASTLNNPVMGIDPSGEFVIAALVIGIAVGATIGAISGGIKAYNNGENVVGGAISGGLVGGAIGLAGAAGVVFLGPLIAGTAAAGAGTNALVALGATTAFSFSAGAGEYVINEKLNDREVKLGNAIGQGTMVALESVWTFGVGGAVGSIGTTGTTGRLLSKEWLGKLTFTQEFTQPFKYPIDIIRNECFR